MAFLNTNLCIKTKFYLKNGLIPRYQHLIFMSVLIFVLLYIYIIFFFRIKVIFSIIKITPCFNFHLQTGLAQHRRI